MLRCNWYFKYSIKGLPYLLVCLPSLLIQIKKKFFSMSFLAFLAFWLLLSDGIYNFPWSFTCSLRPMDSGKGRRIQEGVWQWTAFACNIYVISADLLVFRWWVCEFMVTTKGVPDVTAKAPEDAEDISFSPLLHY